MQDIGNLPPKENQAPDSVKSPGQKFFEEFPGVVERTIELIKTKPGLLFAIYAPGGVLERGEKTGTYPYVFDRKEQQMARPLHESIGYLNQGQTIEGQQNQNEQFQIYMNIYHTATDHAIPATTVSFKIPFGPKVDNDFFYPPRGYNLTFALVFPSDPREIDAIGEPGLKKCLQNPISEEAKVFFRSLFFKCARSWIPDYWNFFFQQMELHEKKGLPLAGVNIYERRIQEQGGYKVQDWKLLRHIDQKER